MKMMMVVVVVVVVAATLSLLWLARNQDAREKQLSLLPPKKSLSQASGDESTVVKSPMTQKLVSELISFQHEAAFLM